MFNPNTNFKVPRMSKKDQVLKKHNAHFKQDGPRKILVTPTENYIIPDGECIKDTFIRIGWIDGEGSLL